jgi:transposase
MDGKAFKADVEQFLCPMLRPGDIVVADNLSCHKVAGLMQAIQAVGAMLLYLPAYSPDLNLIEKVFSKLKSRLRGLAPRTKNSLWKNLGLLLNAFPLRNAVTFSLLVIFLWVCN